MAHELAASVELPSAAIEAIPADRLGQFHLHPADVGDQIED
jgi:hypothetical protein